jgi:hypothetical protein
MPHIEKRVNIPDHLYPNTRFGSGLWRLSIDQPRMAIILTGH